MHAEVFGITADDRLACRPLDQVEELARAQQRRFDQVGAENFVESCGLHPVVALDAGKVASRSVAAENAVRPGRYRGLVDHRVPFLARIPLLLGVAARENVVDVHRLIEEGRELGAVAVDKVGAAGLHQIHAQEMAFVVPIRC